MTVRIDYIGGCKDRVSEYIEDMPKLPYVRCLVRTEAIWRPNDQSAVHAPAEEQEYRLLGIASNLFVAVLVGYEGPTT